MNDQHKSINPSIKISVRATKTVDYYVEGIRSGNRYILSEAITLIESTQEKQLDLAIEVLERLYHLIPSKTLRIGITGSPGVGKSTFIEKFGLFLISKGNKVAVLAIDPSSQASFGSILGDKTRMDGLSTNEMAFVRPSPTGEMLGGTAYKTREAITLCEAAGFNIILIETVGVGQSETEVSRMTDIFLLMLLPGAGDEIQGIKRGVVELADIFLVNKADGDRKVLAMETQKSYRNALQLFTHKLKGWTPRLISVSSLENQGIDSVWQMIGAFIEKGKSEKFIENQRNSQNQNWFDKQIKNDLFEAFMKKEEVQILCSQLGRDILKRKISPFSAGHKLKKMILGKL